MSEQTLIDFLSNTDDAELTTVAQIDALIELHKKSISDNRKEITRCKRRIENLEFKKKKLKYGDNSPIIELAELLHKNKKCITDYMCNWDDLSWDEMISRGYLNDAETDSTEKGYFYERARRLLAKADSLGIGIRKTLKLMEGYEI